MEIDQQSISIKLSLLVHLTNNLTNNSTGHLKTTQTISAERWKESFD